MPSGVLRSPTTCAPAGPWGPQELCTGTMDAQTHSSSGARWGPAAGCWPRYPGNSGPWRRACNEREGLTHWPSHRKCFLRVSPCDHPCPLLRGIVANRTALVLQVQKPRRQERGDGMNQTEQAPARHARLWGPVTGGGETDNGMAVPEQQCGAGPSGKGLSQWNSGTQGHCVLGLEGRDPGGPKGSPERRAVASVITSPESGQRGSARGLGD